MGDNPDHRTIDVLKKNGITTNHKGRQLSRDDFSVFDYIFCMDRENVANVKRVQPQSAKAKVLLFGEYDPLKELIIEDPYYGKVYSPSKHPPRIN